MVRRIRAIGIMNMFLPIQGDHKARLAFHHNDLHSDHTYTYQKKADKKSSLIMSAVALLIQPTGYYCFS